MACPPNFTSLNRAMEYADDNVLHLYGCPFVLYKFGNLQEYCNHDL